LFYSSLGSFKESQSTALLVYSKLLGLEAILKGNFRGNLETPLNPPPLHCMYIQFNKTAAVQDPVFDRQAYMVMVWL